MSQHRNRQSWTLRCRPEAWLLKAEAKAVQAKGRFAPGDLRPMGQFSETLLQKHRAGWRYTKPWVQSQVLQEQTKVNSDALPSQDHMPSIAGTTAGG